MGGAVSYWGVYHRFGGGSHETLAPALNRGMFKLKKRHCEIFQDFIIEHLLEAEHKPFLETQTLNTLPPRIQHFSMRLMRYSYTISHVEGKKNNHSRYSGKGVYMRCRQGAHRGHQHLNHIMENLLVKVQYLDNLHEHLTTDNVCSTVMQMNQDGWPEFNTCSSVS